MLSLCCVFVCLFPYTISDEQQLCVSLVSVSQTNTIVSSQLIWFYLFNNLPILLTTISIVYYYMYESILIIIVYWYVYIYIDWYKTMINLNVLWYLGISGTNPELDNLYLMLDQQFHPIPPDTTCPQSVQIFEEHKQVNKSC